MRTEVPASRDILVIDDNPADVRLVEEALIEAGIEHRLSSVRNGEEALDYLRHRGAYASATWPDLILLDLNLPRKDGRQVLAEVKADAELQRIPVIVLTTSSALHDVALSYGAHANGYVVKPIHFTDLCEVMRSIANFWLRVATLPPHGGI